ncbi:ribokinase [Virgibacillus halodenitrificans]|uniref:ribokinase n=1 Tax=Virgibacillus halodenitrificans TaxID=1482 RepID=UPI00136DFDC0
MNTDKKGKILSIGSYNVGLTCRAGRTPAWGETLIGSDFSESYGGKGSNQAVAAARLGGDVTFIGCVGMDKYGEDALSMLRDNGIHTNYIKQTSDKNTGVGIILLNEHNDNCIIVDLGANSELTAEYVESMELVIQEADVVIFQLETPVETVRAGMQLAKKHGKTIIFNPAPANTAAIDLLQHVTITNPNESELLLLNGKESDFALTDIECEKLARNLLRKGPDIVLVTRGEKDCMVVTPEETMQIPVYPVQAKDTTGAGDAFTGALAVAIAEGKSLKEAVHFANLTGSYCVTHQSVIPGLPTFNQLKRFSIDNNIPWEVACEEKSVFKS